MPATTINNINKALAEKGLPFEIVKGEGYFWFAGKDEAPMSSEDAIDSIYSCQLRGMSVFEYVKHVQSAYEEWASSQEETLTAQ